MKKGVGGGSKVVTELLVVQFRVVVFGALLLFRVVSECLCVCVCAAQLSSCCQVECEKAARWEITACQKFLPPWACNFTSLRLSICGNQFDSIHFISFQFKKSRTTMLQQIQHQQSLSLPLLPLPVAFAESKP